ncbi:MAG TPA: ELWxxDGT repeat protein, partial [Archangium sp.]|nr:ELWxxDGT repeat protein [Archangium sp.]
PEGTVRLKAIRQSESNNPYPTKLVSVGGAVYFSAWDAVYGQELWKSDGTPEGTGPVADLAPGRKSSEPSSLTAAGKTLFFSAVDELTGRELWRTDGTAEGTVRIKDLHPGTGWGLSYNTRLIAAPDGSVFFMAEDGTHGFQLWKTGGTEADMVLVTDNLPNRIDEIGLLSWTHERLYLFTRMGDLWTSDGTPEGTRPLTSLDRKKPGSAPRWPVNMNGTLFFSANDGIHGEELWRSDGTREGTVLVADLAPGNESSSPSSLTPLNGRLLFLTSERGSDGSSFSLWSMDGMGERPVHLTSISTVYDSPTLLVRMGDAVFFTRQSRRNYSDHELWKTDGTKEGTVLVKSVTGPPLGWKPKHLTAVGNRLFFVAEAGIVQEVLWTSDGTGPGTSLVTNLGSGSLTSFKHLVAVGEQLYFWAVTGTRGYELWKSDGTAANTLPLKYVTGDISAAQTAAVGNTLFFFVTPSSDRGPELWKTDGDASVLLKSFHDTPTVPAPTFLTVMKEALYFWAHDGVHGYELWKSDGTAEGTRMLADIAPGAAGAVGLPEPLVLAGPEGPLLFAASDGVSGLEPWQTDGTTEGTVRVADLAPGVESSSPTSMAASGRYVFFQADDFTHGTELWALPRTVPDTTPPLLTCPMAPPAFEATSRERTRVRYSAATATDDSSRPVVRYKPPSDSDLPLGTTPVTVTALDDIGNSATCTFDITVHDTTPPAITCPASLRTEATGPGGAVVGSWAATATDAASLPSIRYSHAPGSTFPLGENRVEATATDDAGLTTTCSFTVTVADTQAPALTCPGSRTVEATRPEGAEVRFDAPLSYDTVSGPEVDVSHSPGLFPVGTTEVKATARDSSGNSNQCSFFVSVRDTTAPSLTCPAAQRKQTRSAEGAEVFFFPAVRASDSVSEIEMKYSHPSGSWFPLGDTTVTVSVTDAWSNQASCTFQVTVVQNPHAPDDRPPPPPRDDPAQGCGCQSGGGSMSGILGLALLGAFTRRRRPRIHGP